MVFAYYHFRHDFHREQDNQFDFCWVWCVTEPKELPETLNSTVFVEGLKYGKKNPIY